MSVDFAAVYDEYYPKVYNYVYYRLLHRQQTEDVVGDVFFRALDNLQQFEGRRNASVATWLITIARNAVTDHYRRGKKIAFVPLEDQEIPTDDLPAAELAASEERRALRALLAGLDERSREALALRYWGEMSYAEIAVQMGISEKNVSVILARAIAKMRTLGKKSFPV